MSTSPFETACAKFVLTGSKICVLIHNSQLKQDPVNRQILKCLKNDYKEFERYIQNNAHVARRAQVPDIPVEMSQLSAFKKLLSKSKSILSLISPSCISISKKLTELNYLLEQQIANVPPVYSIHQTQTSIDLSHFPENHFSNMDATTVMQQEIENKVDCFKIDYRFPQLASDK